MTDTLDALAAGWRGDPANLVAAVDDHEPARRLVAMFRAALPDWQTDAACRRRPDVDFFDPRQQRAALDICARCPVLIDCRHWALEGCVIGGMSPGALRLARRNGWGRTPSTPAARRPGSVARGAYGFPAAAVPAHDPLPGPPRRRQGDG